MRSAVNKAAYDREYRVRNRAKIRLVKRAYRERNRSKLNEYARTYGALNPEKRRKAERKYYSRNSEWIQQTRRERRTEAQSARLRALAVKYYQRDRKLACARKEAYRLRNPGLINARNQARRVRCLRATPPWVDHGAIKAIYVDAAQRGLTVDHIVPLCHPNVCGLHVPWNLQLLPASANFSKSNRWDVATEKHVLALHADFVSLQTKLTASERRLGHVERRLELTD